MSRETEPTRPGSPASDGVQTLRDLVAESKALRLSLDTDRRMWKNRTRLGLGLVVLCMVMLIGLSTVVVQNRQRSIESAEILRRNAALSEQIADCTTNQAGVCLQEGQKRTGRALEQIRQDQLRTEIYVHQCARVAQTDAQLEDCVRRKLAAAAPATSPPAAPTAPPSTRG